MLGSLYPHAEWTRALGTNHLRLRKLNLCYVRPYSKCSPRVKPPTTNKKGGWSTTSPLGSRRLSDFRTVCPPAPPKPKLEMDTTADSLFPGIRGIGDVGTAMLYFPQSILGEGVLK